MQPPLRHRAAITSSSIRSAPEIPSPTASDRRSGSTRVGGEGTAILRILPVSCQSTAWQAACLRSPAATASAGLPAASDSDIAQSVTLRHSVSPPRGLPGGEVLVWYLPLQYGNQVTHCLSPPRAPPHPAKTLADSGSGAMTCCRDPLRKKSIASAGWRYPISPFRSKIRRSEF